MVEESDSEDFSRKIGTTANPNQPNSVHIAALTSLISDKKERVKKILAKPSTLRTNEELSEVANLLQVQQEIKFRTWSS